MARKRATLTDLLNDLTFKTTYNKYKMLATSSFVWEGLPEGIESKYIEKYLFNFGKAIFFRDPEMSYMCLQAEESSKLNVYGEPLHWWATGFQYHKEYNVDDCVIIDNNILRKPTKDLVMFYTNKITEAMILAVVKDPDGYGNLKDTLIAHADVNVKSAKTPIIFACDDKDVLTFKRIFQQVDGNVPAMFVDRGLNIDSITAFDTKVKFMGNDLMDYKKSVENELLTILGFNNLPVDKKERTIVDEVNSNNQLIDNYADLQLKCREKACQMINEKWGLNVTVRRKESEVLTDVENNAV